jgi:hypothetical protein
MKKPVVLDAIVTRAEHPALIAASEQLAESLTAATGDGPDVRLRFPPALAAIDLGELPDLVVMSMLGDALSAAESLSALETRWRNQIQSFQASATTANVFVCTIFRHVPKSVDRSDEHGGPSVERIRRLNLLAAELSHDLGIAVVDVDRVFAHIGARSLQADYRMNSAMAAETAAYAIVSSVLASGLDDLISPDVQERARQHQGKLSQIGTLLNRRLRKNP